LPVSYGSALISTARGALLLPGRGRISSARRPSRKFKGDRGQGDHPGGRTAGKKETPESGAEECRLALAPAEKMLPDERLSRFALGRVRPDRACAGPCLDAGAQACGGGQLGARTSRKLARGSAGARGAWSRGGGPLPLGSSLLLFLLLLLLALLLLAIPFAGRLAGGLLVRILGDLP